MPTLFLKVKEEYKMCIRDRQKCEQGILLLKISQVVHHNTEGDLGEKSKEQQVAGVPYSAFGMYKAFCHEKTENWKSETAEVSE